MSEVEFNKNQIVSQLRHLCAHCMAAKQHSCAIQDLTSKIEAITGIPLIVNNEFRGLLHVN